MLSLKYKQQFDFKLNSKSTDICLIGSCFSDEIGKKFISSKFNCIINPFGTIFHPIALARIIQNAIKKQDNNTVFEQNSNYYSWDFAHKFNASSCQEFNTKSRLVYDNLNDFINKKEATFFITFGTAHAYHLISSDYLVANCHKAPQELFRKELSAIENMFTIWDETITLLKKVNPNLQVFFTVSPVRHIRDGVVENNRSKARLFELISLLEEKHKIYYLPSFELVNDLLRDYSYFKSDFVHPNEFAINEVWNYVEKNLIDN